MKQAGLRCRLTRGIDCTGLASDGPERIGKGQEGNMAMQHEINQAREQSDGTRRKGVDAVVETLATLRCEGESLA